MNTETTGTTDCACSAAGWCARHRLRKPSHWHQLCRTRSDYLALWDQGCGPGQSNRPVDQRCTQRGEVLRTVECRTCGSLHVKLKVFSCGLHQECTLAPTAGAIACCRSCPDRQSTRLNWAVGVTTAPRQDPTLSTCVQSLITAGWQPTVCAEPGTDLSGLSPQARTIVRPQQLGCWHNWLQMCRDLLEQHPRAEAILTVQDDTLFHRQTLQFVDQDLWPGDPEKIGFVAIYTPQHYSHQVDLLNEQGERVYRGGSWYHARNKVQRNPGWRFTMGPAKSPGCQQVVTRSLWGACAMVFPRSSLQRIVEHPIARHWTGASPNPDRPPAEVRNSDTAIGKIVRALKLQQWWYVPSLTEHIAEYSTLNHGGNSGRRHAPSFDAECDLFQVFQSTIEVTS